MHTFKEQYILAVLLAAFFLPSGVSAQPFPKNTNQSRALRSAIVGGSENSIPSNTRFAFIGGGQGNTASGNTSTVGGGSGNTASGYKSTVGGGAGNTASSQCATVPGGSRSSATHNGSFVWGGDASENTDSFGDFTFTVRCEGGARFYTGNGTATGVSLPPGGTSWAALSDRNAKTDFKPVEKKEILDKLAALPVTAWHYKHDPNRHYIGPMAQDFHAAFGLGADDKTISTLDSDGVMYAAIQGLVEELKDRDKAMADRDKTIEQLKTKCEEVHALKAKLEVFEQRLNSLPPGS